MTVDELENMAKANLTPNMKEVVELLVGAFNDWRTGHDEVHEYLSEISVFVGGELTKENLIEKLSEINDKILWYAWEGESLTQLVQIFNVCEVYDLMEIEKILTTYL